MTLSARRVSVVVTVAAVLVLLSTLDASTGRGAAPTPSTGQPVTATAVLRPGPGSSSWFCAGGSGRAASAAETVVVTNPTAALVRGRLTAVPSSGRSVSVAISVAPGGVSTVVPADLVRASWVSAVIVLDRAGVGVVETVHSPLGWTEAPCASSTASQWYFTGLSTAGSDGVALSILNPSVTPAVVDTTIATAVGKTLQPSPYQGVSVPPGSLVTEYLSDHDQNDPSAAVSVTAVSGSVVAATLQSFTAPSGASLQLGAPVASTHWAFAQSERVAGGQVAYHLYDPGRRAAHVVVHMGFAGGTAVPLALTVPAGQQATLQARAEPRLPVGSPYAISFDSTGGAGIVVGRDVRSPPGGGSPQRGASPGTAVSSAQWLLPPLTAPASTPWSLAVEDLSAGPVTFSVRAASGSTQAPVPGLIGVRVTPQQPFVTTSVPAPVGAVPVEIVASGPVAVELDPEPVAAPGVTVDPALPIGG